MAPGISDTTPPPDPTTADPEPWPRKRTLRILCYGDSLTAGYSGLGSSYNPYAERLAARLEKAFPNLRIETTVDGLPGDAVSLSSGKFLSRMESHFDPVDATSSASSSANNSNNKKRNGTTASGERFDWAVVLGGTNDLAYPGDPEKIFEALKRVWAMPLASGCKVLALTVPEAGVKGSVGERVRVRREKVNELIRGYKAKNFHVFDLHAAVPFWSMKDDERKRYWDDAIHLTAEGYDLMGERIAGALIHIIMPPGRLQTNGDRPSKRRKVFDDDGKVFEEEDGDDARLEHGYIVIRKSDLD